VTITKVREESAHIDCNLNGMYSPCRRRIKKLKNG